MTMIDDNTLKQVRLRAIRSFDSGIAQDPLVQELGQVEDPIPIHGPDGNVKSWFIGVTVKERLVGFIHYDIRQTLIGYSTFQRQTSSLEGCPLANVWLDPETVMRKASTLASSDDVLSSPILTYDKHPSRIVWSVKATNKDGTIRTILVAGEYAYLPENSESISTGQNNKGDP